MAGVVVLFLSLMFINALFLNKHSPFFYSNFKLLRKNPTKKLIRTANEVAADLNDAIRNSQNLQSASELRVLLPLIVEVKKRVSATLLRHEGRAKMSKKNYANLRNILEELIRIEKVLRSIPKPAVTLEQVLAGQFDVTSKNTELVPS